MSASANMISPLAINASETIALLSVRIREQVEQMFRRKGAVVGISGGVDSSVCAALCSRGLGADHVLGLATPERHSSPDSRRLAEDVAQQLGIRFQVVDITSILEAAGCYRLQQEALKEVIPEVTDTWVFKIGLPSVVDGENLPVPHVTAVSPSGDVVVKRLPSRAYSRLVAATNLKQRVRKMVEYYHADAYDYAVCGTPNRLEYELGFFVKGGDGLSDFKPIAHLYKTQVYDLAGALQLPDEVVNRVPTTDTFPLAQTQEEFFFGLPYRAMDWCVFGVNNGLTASYVAERLELQAEQVERVYRDIHAKRRATLRLHVPPLLMEEVSAVAEATRSFVDHGQSSSNAV